ncbi:MAG: DUF4136 domain-containing protein [Flavobacteriaceae bacterium]|nr:DUF4136 domain-containing protein [Flavobacteriaceae bacterium]
MLILVLLAVSCQTTNIVIDYEKGYDFSAVKTYGYYTDNAIQLNRIDSVNFISSLDAALQAKGLIKDPDPDIFIAVQVQSKDETRVKSILNLGLGGGSGGFGVGTGIGIPIKGKVKKYSIRIDFDDAKTKTLKWTGETFREHSYKASSESKKSFYKSDIQSLLKKYPPQ